MINCYIPLIIISLIVIVLSGTLLKYQKRFSELRRHTWMIKFILDNSFNEIITISNEIDKMLEIFEEKK